MDSGVCRIPCRPTIVAGVKNVCGFSKRHDTATGVCGVARYNVMGLTTMLNIDIIFDNGYSSPTRFGIHIGAQTDPGNRPSSKNVVHDYQDWHEQTWFHWGHAKTGRPLSVKLDGVEVIVTMRDAYRAIMKVEVWGGDRYKHGEL